MTAPALPDDQLRPAWHRWAWLLVLGGGVASYLLVLRTLVATQNPFYVPSLVLLGSAVVPASVLVYAAAERQRGPVGAATIAAVAGFGGVFGTVAAGTLEYDTLQRLGTVSMLSVGLIEESAKLVVPLVILVCSRRLRSIPAAGVVIGIASGMGFATLETMGYGFSALLNSGSIADVDQTLLLRGLLSPAGHVAWTGITAAALWQVPTASRRGRSIVLLIAAFVGSVALHGLWDGSHNVIVRTLVALVSFSALLLVVHRSRELPPAASGVPAAETFPAIPSDPSSRRGGQQPDEL